MKLSLSMYSLVSEVQAGRMDLPGFIDFAAAQGVAGVELLDIFWRDAERELPMVKERIAAAGLEMAVYSISNDFIQPEPSARLKQLADLKRGVDISLELGTGVMRVFSGSAREGVSQQRGMAWIIEGLAAGAAYAEQKGVTLALENHGSFAGRSDQVRDIIEHVASPALRVNLDTGNFLPVGQDPLQAAKDLADLVALVHLKDMGLAAPDESEHVFIDPEGRSLAGAVLGDGLVDLTGIYQTLAKADYDGWWSLEYEGSVDPLTLGVPHSLAMARKFLA